MENRLGIRRFLRAVHRAAAGTHYRLAVLGLAEFLDAVGLGAMGLACRMVAELVEPLPAGMALVDGLPGNGGMGHSVRTEWDFRQ